MTKKKGKAGNSRSKKSAEVDSATDPPAPENSKSQQASSQSDVAKVPPVEKPTTSPSGNLRKTVAGNSLAKTFSFVLLLAIIGLIGLLSYKVMRSFLLPLFLAALVVVIFRPVHAWIAEKCGNRDSLAAGLTTAAILLLALGPIAWMVAAGVQEGLELTHPDKVRKLTTDLKKLTDKRKEWGWDRPFGGRLDEIGDDLAALKLEQPQAPDFANEILYIEDFQVELPSFLEEVMAAKDKLEVEEAVEAAGKGGAPTKSGKLERMEQAIESLGKIITVSQEPDADPSVKPPLMELGELASRFATGAQAQPSDIEHYEELVGVMQYHYTAARQKLMGGALLAPLIELVNPNEDRIRQWQTDAGGKLRSWMVKISGQGPSFMGSLLMQIFIFAVSTFYFLLDGPQMITSAMRLSPMDDEHEAAIVAEFAKLSRAVVVATLLSAIVQGALAGMGYFAVWGFDSLFILIMLTTILAMIPFVGAAAVWVPACIYLALVEGRIPAAIGLAVYGTCIVSMADNVIKPWVLKGQSNLHPLFALLSVLGGVQTLGPIGVLVGPMVVAFLQSLLKILHKEMHGEEISNTNSGSVSGVAT